MPSQSNNSVIAIDDYDDVDIVDEMENQEHGNPAIPSPASVGSGPRQDVVILLEDDDMEEDDMEEGQRSEPAAHLPILMANPSQETVLIDLDDDDYPSSESESDDPLEGPEVEFLRAEVAPRKSSNFPMRRKSSIYPQRSPPITEPFFLLETLQHNGLNLRAGKSVQLAEGDFIRIACILQNRITSTVTIRGLRMQRTNSMNGLLEKKLNEVCVFYEIDLDDPRPAQEQSAVEIPISEVKAIRSVKWTNQKFPLDRNVVTQEYQTPREAQKTGGLTARWKCVRKYASAKDRHHNKEVQRVLERIREDDISSRNTVSEVSRRLAWRGETILGGEFRPDIKDNKPIPAAFLGVTAIESGSSGIPRAEAQSGIAVQSASNSVLEARPTKRRKLTPSEVEGRIKSGDVDLWARNVYDVIEETREGEKRIFLEVRMTETPRVNDHKQQKVLEGPSRALSTGPAEIPPMGTLQPQPHPEAASRTRCQGQMLTYGDAFCGAGGTTRGAVLAGLRISWGFDFSEHATKSWRKNFENARCYPMAAHEFVAVALRAKAEGFGDIMKVDILHLSPPCQYFSVAHSINGKDDEKNTASLYAVREVISVSKPRIVTLEQTFGLTHPRFKGYFNSLIQMFTSLDFSVRWALVSLQQWGLPQRRKRLIIIAACPGEILPEFPAPTHSGNPKDGLQPYTTVNNVISRIPADAPDHEPKPWDDPKSLKQQPYPYNGDQILPRSMTCHGGQNWHPSGLRDFTIREYACLQGFPMNHVFEGSYRKRQVGNAVPPRVAKVLFKHIKKVLDERDGLVEERDAIVLDD